MDFKNVLTRPGVYRLWQAPFAKQKLSPVVASGVLANARTVLDVGCGPGTNAAACADVASYVGVDVSSDYIDYARKHYSGDFRVLDVSSGFLELGQFDLILMNSLMHHLDNEGASHLLRALPALCAPGGEIHIVDLVLASQGVERRLALADRGEFPRTIEAWKELVSTSLEVAGVEPFHVGLGPISLWELVHIRARPRGRDRC